MLPVLCRASLDPRPRARSIPTVPHEVDQLGASQLQRIYGRRFEALTEYRNDVWRTLNDACFSQWIGASDVVLDVGSGYGEFINNVQAGARYAMDLNPDSASTLEPGVQPVQQDCSASWPLDDGALDVVFSSNFLEHLPSKTHVLRTLEHAFRCLRPGGRIILLGPNLRFVGGEYWDFFDHHVPLTDRSIVEALQTTGFEIDVVHPRFLPYTMSDGRRYPMWVLRGYLTLQPAWRVLGKQFLVVAHRPDAGSTP